MKTAEETAPPTLDRPVKRDNAAQGLDFSAGHISIVLWHRALPAMTCDFRNILCDLLFGTVSKFI